MAPPLPLQQYFQKDSREELQRRIQDAPLAHADAVLSAYDLLQELEDSGALDLLCGALGAKDVLVNQVVSLVSAPESVNAMRNLILLWKTLGGIDPGRLHSVVESLQTGMPKPEPEAPSLAGLGKRMASKDGRRGLAAAIGFLEVLGKSRSQGS